MAKTFFGPRIFFGVPIVMHYVTIQHWQKYVGHGEPSKSKINPMVKF